MANNRLSQLQISFVKRNSSYRGPSSSELLNDSFDEIGQDLNELFLQWNSYLFPLLNLLPDGSIDSGVNAYLNGLDGRTMYVNSSATLADDPTYWKTSKDRPNTIYEQFANVYSYVDNQISGLNASISSFRIAADQVLVYDDAGNFSGDSVESVLSELVDRLGTYNDHGYLSGLNDDDHPIYLPVNGSRSMTASLNLNGNDIIAPVNIMGDGGGIIQDFATVSCGTLEAGTVNLGSNAFIIDGYQIEVETETIASFGQWGAPFFWVYKNGGDICPIYGGIGVKNINQTASAFDGALQTDQASVGKLMVTLPAITANKVGSNKKYLVTTTNGIRITAPGGVTIRSGASVSSAGGYCEATTVGNCIELVAISATEWYAISTTGTWTFA